MTDLAPFPAARPRPSPPSEERPAHYRLSKETWEIILKEYREGATAPFLSRKWRVSEHALRRRITQHGATKRDWGDEQAIGQALAREAELEEARRNSPEAVAARLFDGVADLTGDEAADPAALARVAVLASGRAMIGRRWVEARALAGLAESYARLAERAARGGYDGGGPTEPDEAAFEAVRRKVLGWTADPVAFSASGTASPRPSGSSPSP